MKYKNFEVIHGENEKNLASSVNKKLEEGFILVGDIKVVPLNISRTHVGFEIHKYNFYQAVAKIED